MDDPALAIAELLTALSPEPEIESAPAESVSAPPTPENPGLIFAHQQHVFRPLLTTARAFAKENWFSLSVLPRWHTLLVGATGTGKSFLARELAKQLGWPLLSMYVTRWIIAGARGTESWREIAKWLAGQHGKCVLFLDEIDKISGDESWSRHLRTEIFQLLDRDLPAELELTDSEGESSSLALWAKAQKVLRCDCLLIAAGAFQHLWEFRPKALGFSGETSGTIIPSQQELKSVLPTELVNRFGKILALPPLGQTDYVLMIQRTAESLPGELREKFIRIADEKLAEAIGNGLGARFCEECITEALLDDAKEKLPQKTTVSRRRSISP